MDPGDDNDRDGVLDFAVPFKWQLGINLAPAVGAFIGLLSAAAVSNRIGSPQTGMLAMVMAAFFLAVPLVSTLDMGLSKDSYLGIFMVGQFLLGIPWGLLSGIITSYVSDVTPLRLRVFATTMINIFWLIGAEFAIFAIIAFDGYSVMPEDWTDPRDQKDFPNAIEERDHWASRGPMLMQYLWILPLLFVIYRTPESPLFWVRKGKLGEALKCLRYLNRDPAYNPKTALDAIMAVDEREKSDSEQAGFFECFHKANLRRTEIASMAMITQQSVGQQLITFGVKLITGAGTPTAAAMWCSFGIFVAYGAANLTSIWVMTRFGRRTGWIWGLIGIILCLVAMGVMGFVEGGCGPMTAVTVAFAIIFNSTIGPISFTIVSETPSSRLKTATNAAARGSFIVLAMGNTAICQYCLSPIPEGVDLGCKIAFFWAITTVLCLVWAWFRLPEMKGRTPAEIDILFEQKVPTRHWPEQQLDSNKGNFVANPSLKSPSMRSPSMISPPMMRPSMSGHVNRRPAEFDTGLRRMSSDGKLRDKPVIRDFADPVLDLGTGTYHM